MTAIKVLVTCRSQSRTSKEGSLHIELTGNLSEAKVFAALNDVAGVRDRVGMMQATAVPC
jgi:hypothetical protein